jgi:hypothetical protein
MRTKEQHKRATRAKSVRSVLGTFAHSITFRPPLRRFSDLGDGLDILLLQPEMHEHAFFAVRVFAAHGQGLLAGSDLAAVDFI